MLSRLTALCLLLPALLVVSPPAARAQSPGPTADRRRAKPSRAVMAEARRRFTRGNKLYRQGNYKEALLLYQAALDLYQEPVILYNLAQTYEKLRNPAQAAHHFERYLKTAKSAADRRRVERRIKQLKRLAKLEVHVSSYPPGAAIYVDRRSDGVKGRTPFKLQLPLGKQKVILELAGFIAEERSITVRLGERNLVDVQLRRRSSIKVDADIPGARSTVITPKGRFTSKCPHLFELSPGTYPIQVELAGFHPVKREVELSAGEQISLLVNLKPLPKYGNFQVEGVVGATVVLEGRTFAHLPMKAKQIPAGSYLVSVTREGYRTWESRVNISADRLTVARLSLTPVRGTAAKTVIYSSAGVAAGSLVAGTIFGILALSTDRDYNSSAPDVETQQTGRTQALMADVFFVLTAAATATAVVTYFATQRGPSTANVTLADLPAEAAPVTAEAAPVAAPPVAAGPKK